MLNHAILRRLNGNETLTGEFAQAQTLTAALDWHFGPLDPKGSTFPCGTFFEDAGTESLGGVDVGVVNNSVYRFLVWDKTRDGSVIPKYADAVEKLFDRRRGVPNLDIVGDGVCYWSDLFVPLQAPLQAMDINAFYGIMAFRFVEARP